MELCVVFTFAVVVYAKRLAGARAELPANCLRGEVPANTSSPLVYSVKVVGGNSAPATATDSALIGGPNACASLPSGNESVMNGQYAAVAQGWQGLNGTPNVTAFSVALDGAGRIKNLGAGMGGELDLSNATTGPQHFTIMSTGSFYTVGLELNGFQTGDASAGYVGCMELQTSGGPFTFVFGPGGFASGIATAGAILQINDESGTKSFVSGSLKIQDATAFSNGDTSALHAHYTFGEHGGDPNGRYAIAGSFVLNASSGLVSSFTADQNAAGTSSNISGTGTISSVSSKDGRAMASFAVQGSPGAANNSVFYIVNANEIFIVGADTFGPGNPVRSGQAVASTGSYTASSIAGNQIVHTTGQSVCNMQSVTAPCANAALGLLNFAADSSTTGTVTGSVFQFDIQNGERIASIAAGSPGTFALASSTGRVTVGNAGANLSILYLASPASNSEPVTFFIVGTDSAASFGYAEQGATAPIDAKVSLNGSYFIVNDDSGDSSVWAQLGVIRGYADSVAGTWDYNSGGGQELNDEANEYTDPLSITNLDPSHNPAPGVGKAGAGIVAITNGKRILCLVEGGQFPKLTTVSSSAAILIAEPQ